MAIDEEQAIIARTNILYLKRYMEKLIKRKRRKDGVYGKNRTASERDKREAV